jgi:hypothetical protein
MREKGMILLRQIQTKKKRGNLGWKPLFAAAVMKKQNKEEEAGRRLWQAGKAAEVTIKKARGMIGFGHGIDGPLVQETYSFFQNSIKKTK